MQATLGRRFSPRAAIRVKKAASAVWQLTRSYRSSSISRRSRRHAATLRGEVISFSKGMSTTRWASGMSMGAPPQATSTVHPSRRKAAR